MNGVPGPRFDPLFTKLVNGRIYEERDQRRKRTLVNWPKAVQSWKRMIAAQPEVPVFRKPLYTAIINLPGGGHYPMTWLVVKAHSILHRERLSMTTWKAGSLKQSARISQSYHRTVSGPIIVVEYPMINTERIVIDGNHRILEAANANPNTLITGYLFPFPLMLESLVHPNFLQYFQIHWDIAQWLWIECQDEWDGSHDIPPKFLR